MKIRTNSPVVYSNAFGDGQFFEKIKGFGEKAKGFVQKVKDKGGKVGQFAQNAKQIGQGFKTQQQGAPQQVQMPVMPPPPTTTEEKGMSKGLKMGLIIGGSVLALGVIGFIIYKSSKSSK